MSLSLFSTTDAATDARINYYKKCGIDVVNVHKSADAVRLDCANGFEAFAFSEEFIHSIMKKFGYERLAYKEHENFYFVNYRFGLNLLTDPPSSFHVAD